MLVKLALSSPYWKKAITVPPKQRGFQNVKQFYIPKEAQVLKKIPQAQQPVEEQLDNENKVVHVSRPDSGKMKSPIRIIS